MRRHVLLFLPVLLAACAPASNYQPLVADVGAADRARYETDLRDCKKAAERNRYTPIFVAVLQGASLGTALGAVGGWWAGAAPEAAEGFSAAEGYGAASGAVAGAAVGGSAVHEKVDERRYVDQCLRNNGYKVGG